jgi:uncharacterized protein
MMPPFFPRLRFRRAVFLLFLMAGMAPADPSAPPNRVTPNPEKEREMSEPRAVNSTEHTNRLIDATSPYLLQHAHNPVDWYPWGEAAWEKARQEDKPVFLSIGYSACHWCHVMAHESFESNDIAEILNQHFVSIKVDREERPDLDDIYMTATMIYNRGQGGWPMSVFLTPDQKPFFAGTYFPPDARYGRPGFKEILETIVGLWQDDRQKLLESADSLTQAVTKYNEIESSRDPIRPDIVRIVADTLAQHFDKDTGGLLSGQTNKFPPSMAMSLMLRAYHHSREKGEPRTHLLDLVTLTLDHMARGGIYDHLGGGIARYSTDPQWLVPHFEKMLYDQALVSGIYLEGFQITGEQRYADVAMDIFDYVLEDFQSPPGGFYSARDADSEGEEGKYYVWTKQEIQEALNNKKMVKLFCDYYDVSKSGNWEGSNILNVQRDLETVARQHDMEPQEARTLLQEARQKLREVRAKRVPPGLDDKVLTSWNGLMIASLARGGRILDDAKYTQAAVRAAEFILAELSRDGRLLRTFREGKAHTLGYLDDYAFFVDALIELYQTTFDPRWLDEAVRLTDDMLKHFRDTRDGGFFFTANDAEELLLRTKDTRDSAVPAGNSVALLNLLRLAKYQMRDDLRDIALGTMQAYAARINEQPFGFERFLAGVDFHRNPTQEVVFVGDAGDPTTQALIRTVAREYHPNRIALLLDPQAAGSERLPKRYPLLEGKTLVDGKPAVYVCRDFTCRRPVTTAEELMVDLR